MADTESPSIIDELRTLLEVEEIDTNLYRGPRQPGGVGRVFGGQVIAQGLMAATRSTDPKRLCHSLHAYFMRPGDEDHPIIYRVSRDHDGGSFSTRRVIAFQQGDPILNMACSFQALEPGLEHQAAAMPDVPPPEDLPEEAEQRALYVDRIPERFRKWFLRERPFEQRPVGGQTWMDREKRAPAQQIWFRARGLVGDAPTMHRAMLAYASDMYLLGTAVRPHGVNWMVDNLQTASLDHAMWLHDDFRVDDWLLYATDSPWSARGRGFNRGQIFTRDGRLVASVAQEALMRLKG